MHDLRLVRDNPAAFDTALSRRFLSPHGARIAALDEQRRVIITEQQTLQFRRNDIAKTIGQMKREGQDTEVLQQHASEIRDQIAALEQLASDKNTELTALLDTLPNRLDDDVPEGRDENDNLEIKSVGERGGHFSDEDRQLISSGIKKPQQHFELGESFGLMDFEAAARVSGARFTVLRGALARLERALGQFMLDLHTTEHGYTETAVPGLVNDAALYGTGQLPKFAEDCFRTTDGRWLIPTAEVPLTNLVAGQILPHAALPLRMAALTDCYRSEAGSAGRDTRGMLRQHQFRKVEMVSIVAPEDSAEEHERMTRCAETVLEKLGLPYRRMLLCAGDTGFSAAKTFDLEVWLPGQNMWREISSCSNCRDFQARRMNARVRAADGKTIRHVHTLNGSGVAVGRALIAVMENYQQADGSIAIPAALRPYTMGLPSLAQP